MKKFMYVLAAAAIVTFSVNTVSAQKKAKPATADSTAAKKPAKAHKAKAEKKEAAPKA